MLNQKQNLLRMLDGEMPEYVPVARFGPGVIPLTVGGLTNPSILGDFRGPNGDGYSPATPPPWIQKIQLFRKSTVGSMTRR